MQVVKCEVPFTLCLDDPMGNVYVYAADPNDPNLASEYVGDAFCV